MSLNVLHFNIKRKGGREREEGREHSVQGGVNGSVIN